MKNVQLANTYNPMKNYGVDYWYASPKFDGIRAIFIKGQGFFTRNGNKLNFPKIADALDNFCSMHDDLNITLIDGEMFLANCSFQEIQSVVLSENSNKKNQVEFHPFAMVGKFKDTREMIENLPCYHDKNIFPVNYQRVLNNSDAIYKLCEKFTVQGYEGNRDSS